MFGPVRTRSDPFGCVRTWGKAETVTRRNCITAPLDAMYHLLTKGGTKTEPDCEIQLAAGHLFASVTLYRGVTRHQNFEPIDRNFEVVESARG